MPSIFYSESGKGLPVVFLHGYCETSMIWAEFKNFLSRRNRVITIDLPGFGKSPRLNYAFSLQDIAAEIKQVLDERKVTSFVLIGHSLGGYVALAFAKQFPFALKGLGLFHSSIFEDTPDKKENRTKLIEFIKSNGVKPFIKTFMPSLFFEKNRRNFDELIDELSTTAEKTSPEMAMEYARAMRDRVSSVDFIKRFRKPVMFIIGEKDQSIPLKKSLEQAVIPANSHVLRLKDVGHMGMYENTADTLKFVQKFVAFCR
ncbi:MAG: alpha/beta hydrolase [Cyclobacteriaceae bacterium]|nr:alpha/beta hydrolase [Cyclobacteriaceae bacterium]